MGRSFFIVNAKLKQVIATCGPMIDSDDLQGLFAAIMKLGWELPDVKVVDDYPAGDGFDEEIRETYRGYTMVEWTGACRLMDGVLTVNGQQ
jgi:hypothetical protein